MRQTQKILGSLAVGLLITGAGAAAFAAQEVTPESAGNESRLGADNERGDATRGGRERAEHRRGHSERGPKTPETLVQRYDRNEDGVLQLAELPERKRDRMTKADTDADGALSLAEIQAHFDARLAEKFSKKDTDGDGFITMAEVGEEKWAYFGKADTDADAQVSMDEFKAAKAAGTLGHDKKHGKKHGKKHHKGGKHGKKHHKGGNKGSGDPLAWMLDHFDANENDQLELTEVPKRMQERLAAADADSDGVVSKEELKAAWIARRAEHFAAKDANGDGAISEDDVSERRWKFVSKADANEDGNVTRAELEAAFKSGALKKHGRRAKH